MINSCSLEQLLTRLIRMAHGHLWGNLLINKVFILKSLNLNV